MFGLEMKLKAFKHFTVSMRLNALEYYNRLPIFHSALELLTEEQP